MKAINIVWDTDGEDILLPNEIELPDEIDIADEDAVSDYLTDYTGFCHAGFFLSE